MGMVVLSFLVEAKGCEEMGDVMGRVLEKECSGIEPCVAAGTEKVGAAGTVCKASITVYCADRFE
ncbi:hypothetical protein LguiB_005853 [Lonicera macranthoides]